MIAKVSISLVAIIEHELQTLNNLHPAKARMPYIIVHWKSGAVLTSDHPKFQHELVELVRYYGEPERVRYEDVVPVLVHSDDDNQ